MKRVLIISPHFPPVNAADMHRVRQSLPYFEEFGWQPVVVAVDEAHVEAYSIDHVLLQTVPQNIEVHKVKAWDIKKTRKYGLGSLSMRSYFHIKKKGDELLAKRKFDLVYFSTTAFHVMALGPRWKKKFDVPFILDIQDPWRRDFYLDKPKYERPPKFFITYEIDKWLERSTVPKASGIISVSQGYCDTLLRRYPVLQQDQFKVITFGASAYDFDVMEKYVHDVKRIRFSPGKTNIVYIGRGGHDMRFALEIIFKTLQKGLIDNPALFSNLHFWFIGSSYATSGKGKQTIKPLADSFNVGEYVTEITDRIPYFDSLFLLTKADILLAPGSTDTSYTASKIFPYILAKKHLLGIFHQKSSVVEILTQLKYGSVIAFDHLTHSAADYVGACVDIFQKMIAQKDEEVIVDMKAFAPYTAKYKTQEQIAFFNKVVYKNVPTN